MLRVDHVSQLIPVLGQVIRVAVTVPPALEHLRAAVSAAAKSVTHESQHRTGHAKSEAKPLTPGASPPYCPSELLPMLHRWARDLQQSREFERAVTLILGATSSHDTTRSGLLRMLRGRIGTPRWRSEGGSGLSKQGNGMSLSNKAMEVNLGSIENVDLQKTSRIENVDRQATT